MKLITFLSNWVALIAIGQAKDIKPLLEEKEWGVSGSNSSKCFNCSLERYWTGLKIKLGAAVVRSYCFNILEILLESNFL